MLIDRLLTVYGSGLTRYRCQALTTHLKMKDETVSLVKPQTYMNRSGSAVACLLKKYGVPPNRVLIVLDDVALPLGRLRIRTTGGDGSHNGLKSILAALDTTDVPRLRLGIGPGERQPEDLVDFVLSPFRPQERAEVESMLDRAQAAIHTLLHDGIERAMSQFNS